MAIFCSLAVLILGIVKVTWAADAWSYEAGKKGPANWYEHYETCQGNRQSPVNIKTSDVTYSAELEPFASYDYHQTEGMTMTAVNDGHTVKVELSGAPPSFQGGGLQEEYTAVQFHFHWGANSSVGSEHTVNGRRFPLEMHIVHRRAAVDLVTALRQPSGLAVLGILFEVGCEDERNAWFDQFFEKLDEIVDKGAKVEIDTVALLKLLPYNTDKFWRYKGGLTTPPCFESVIWTVFQQTIKIPESRLLKLRQLSQKSKQEFVPIVNNYRPVQDLAGRSVFTSTQ